MKVAIITEVSTLHVNGVSRTITKLLDFLIENDHQALVLGPEKGTYKSVRLVGTFGIPLYFYPELKLNFALPHLIIHLLRFQPDVIHLVDPNLLGPQMLLACKILLPNTPIVSSYHTNIALYAKMFGFSMLFNPIWATHRLYHGSSQRVLCPSYSTKDELVRNGFQSEKVVVWSRGVDTELFNPSRKCLDLRDSWIEDKPGSLTKKPKSSRSSSIDKDEGVGFGLDIPSNKIVLLYVGRISWEKNLRVLVDAYTEMNHELFHLVIVGDGPARQSIEQLLQHTDVSFTGYLKGENLARAYASADIFVFPSISETFGQVVLEAQASGLPVVAMVAEGVKEIVQHRISGILVDPSETETASHFRSSIEEIAHTSGTLSRMSKQALVRSKDFTWDAAMRTCLEAYTDATATTTIATS